MLGLDPCVSRHRLKLNSRRSYLPKTFRNKGWRQIVLTKSLKVVFQFGLFSWHGCRLLVQLKIVQDPKAKNAKGEIKVYPFSFLNGVHPYKDPNGPGVQANHNKPNKTPHPTTRRPANSPAIFFLEFGRCRSKARSLHEHKLSKRRLYKDTVGPYEQANRSRITKKHTRPPNHDDPQIPQPDLRFVKAKKTQTRHTKGQGPKQKHPQKMICQWTQRSYHCVTLKNMPELIIHYDIQ